MICRSFNHFSQRHASRFVPLAYQPENNDIPVQTPPSVALDALRTIAVSRIYLDNFDHITAYWVGMRDRSRSRRSRRQRRIGAESLSPAIFQNSSPVGATSARGVHAALPSKPTRPSHCLASRLRPLKRPEGRVPERDPITVKPAQLYSFETAPTAATVTS